jgi:hypothetical protein
MGSTDALGPAGEGKVWLRTEDGRYVKMTAAARATMLKLRPQDLPLQMDLHGLPLPAAPEDEAERARVAATKAALARAAADEAASVAVRLCVGGDPPLSVGERAHVAEFGARLARIGPSARLVAAQPPLADTELSNAAEVGGAVALVERGAVSFVEKARRAQAAGAVGLVIVNSEDAEYVPLGMPGDEDVYIPVVCVTRTDGQAVAERLRSEHGSAALTLEFGDDSEEAYTDGGADDAYSGTEDSSTGEDESFLITVPEGAAGGSELEVSAPDGRLVTVQIPVGVTAGQQLRVDMAQLDAGDDYLMGEYTEDDEEETDDSHYYDSGDDFSEDPSDEEEYVMVTIPEGVEPGQRIRVQSPTARRSAIVEVPEGVVAGQQLRVVLPPLSEAAAAAAAVSPPPTSLGASDESSGACGAAGPEHCHYSHPHEPALGTGTDHAPAAGTGAMEDAAAPAPPAPPTPEPAAAASAAAAADGMPALAPLTAPAGPSSFLAPASFQSPRSSRHNPPAPAPPAAAPPAPAAAAPAPAPAPMQPQPAADPDALFAVTIPPGVTAGQQIRVQMPDGQCAVVSVPAGVGPGQQFRVQVPSCQPRPAAPPPPAVAAETAGGGGGLGGGGVAGAPQPHEGGGVAPGQQHDAAAVTAAGVEPPRAAAARAASRDGSVLPAQQLSERPNITSSRGVGWGKVGLGTEPPGHRPVPVSSQVGKLGGSDVDAPEIDIEATAGLGRQSSLEPPADGKVWYRRTDVSGASELVQLTRQQRDFAIKNLLEQGLAIAQQVDDNGDLLPDPYMDLRAFHDNLKARNDELASQESSSWCSLM